MKTTTLPIENSMNCSPLRRGFIFVAIAWFALSPAVRAVSPPPDGGYANGNTAEGTDALFSLTTGTNNTAAGFLALFHNTTGFDNTANGFEALALNTTGFQNVANGFEALFHNTTGFQNVANGFEALFENTSGFHNTVNGFEALLRNTTGNHNTANGDRALEGNTTGNDNTTDGAHSLGANTTGSRNIALGFGAGGNLTTGNDNIDIGNAGVVGEANTIRIGTEGTQSATFIAGISRATVAGGVGVIVDTNGHLGTVSSSTRFKDQIKPMDKASEGILALRPVTFRYKQEFDPKGIPQFGLVAEEVEKVNPDLVARDAEGKVFTVRYEAVNAMLLNEFLKEHRTVQELKSTVAKQETTIARQQKQIEALTSGLQKVSAQLELRKPAPRTVNNQ
ncbi:MAG TPA: tail fiber domain-containing protein [Chthoniobacterales bacterium]|nr:tail fiber domain-containing protein [Chthoniobacterales bacterium]